jgi:hypothetical protein
MEGSGATVAGRGRGSTGFAAVLRTPASRALRSQTAGASTSAQQGETTLDDVMGAITASHEDLSSRMEDISTRIDKATAMATEALGTAQAAHTAATTAQTTAATAQTTAQDTRTQLELLQHQVEFNTMLQLDAPEKERRASNIILNDFPVPADSNSATLKQTVIDKFQTATPDLVQAADILETIKLSTTTVKVIFQQRGKRDDVWKHRNLLRRLAVVHNRLFLAEDLSRAMQDHQKLMQPVRQYLNKTIPAAANGFGAFMKDGILKYHIIDAAGNKVAKAHPANWRPDLVDLAKEQLHVLTALEQAGQPLPARHADLA